ncbi:four helix bundle protein [Candidatus Curtissbacteria bacterium]|nr:four helix bundle protein [Candidatus Curtissbacteria bacterium]
MRRAATSIAANIVEGYVRGSTKEFIRFLDIAIGSTAELDVHASIAKELKFLKERNYQEFENLRVEVAKLLFAYRKSLRAKLNS